MSKKLNGRLTTCNLTPSLSLYTIEYMDPDRLFCLEKVLIALN